MRLPQSDWLVESRGKRREFGSPPVGVLVLVTGLLLFWNHQWIVRKNRDLSSQTSWSFQTKTKIRVMKSYITYSKFRFFEFHLLVKKCEWKVKILSKFFENSTKLFISGFFEKFFRSAIQDIRNCIFPFLKFEISNSKFFKNGFCHFFQFSRSQFWTG